MKTYTNIKDLLRDTNYGQRTVILPHEMYLEEIRMHYPEVFQGLRGLSLKASRHGVHSIMVQAKDENAYEVLTTILDAAKTKYSLLGPKGKPVSPASSAA
jgi:hypothetical protein